MQRFRFSMMAGMVLGLAACGGDRAPEETAAPAPPAAAPGPVTAPETAPAEAAPPPPQEAQLPSPDRVPRVSPQDLAAPPETEKAGKPGAPIEFKYQLAGAPQVGQPLLIDFALVPLKANAAVRLMVATSGSLTLGRSTAPAMLRNVEAGAEYWHELVVTPQENGTFSVNLIATVGEGSQALARTFAIPVVVGSASMDNAKARELNNPVDATGQPIEVMPGQESR
jgi:hypothetical protein